MPVQRCTLPSPIPLLPLWTVQPVQSLSACTTVHFNFTYTSNPPMDRRACTEPQCLYNGALYLCIYLYSPYGPYGLYRAPVPIQRCTLTLPIPLTSLWAIRSVQGLSACTTLHINFTNTSKSLWTVPPVENLSTCKRVHINFTYTSTPQWAVLSVQSLSSCKTVQFSLTYTSTHQ